jgi:ribosomal protein L34
VQREARSPGSTRPWIKSPEGAALRACRIPRHRVDFARSGGIISAFKFLPAKTTGGTGEAMKTNVRNSKLKKRRVSGFRQRNSTKAGKKVINRRRARGRTATVFG